MNPRRRAAELEKIMQCNCDLDNWKPEKSTGHSWVCDIHKKAIFPHPSGSKDSR